MQMTSLEPRSPSRRLGGFAILTSLALLGFTGCATPEEQEPSQPAAKKPADKADKPEAKTPDKKPDGGPIVAPSDKPAQPDKAQPKDPPDESPAGGNGGAGPDQKLGDFAKEEGLAEQERKELAKNYLKTGRNLSMELRYREALQNYERAHKLDPTNVEAALEYEKCAWIVGDRAKGEYKDTTRELANERVARIKQARIEMDRLFQEGEILVEKQKYDEAIQRYERVLEALKWFPYEIDQGGSQRKKTEERIANAKKLQADSEQRRRDALHDASQKQAEFEKIEATKYVEAQLKLLQQNARDAYDAKKWEKCIQLCDEILAKRPGDTASLKLRAACAENMQTDYDIRIYRDKVEGYRRQFEWLETDAVPYQEILQFPDADAWAEVSRREASNVRHYGEENQSEEALEITRKLDTQKIKLAFEATPFGEAIDFLRDYTGINYVITQAAQDIIDGDQLKVSLRLNDITLRNALNLILAAKEDLIYVIKNGVILITTKAGEKKQVFLDFYDVSDIINAIPNFPAPDLGLPQGTGGSGKGSSSTGAQITFNDDKKAGQGTGLDADKLKEIVDTKLGDAGDTDNQPVEISNGVLIARKTAEAHKKIQTLLTALRRTVGIMVTVEARFVDIQDNFLEEIGVDVINSQPSDYGNTSPPDGFGSIALPRGANGPATESVGYNYTNRTGDYNQRAGILNALSQAIGVQGGNPFNVTSQGGLSLQWNYLHNFQLQAMLDAVTKKQKARLINAPRLQCFSGQKAHMMAIRQRAYIAGVETSQTGVTPVLNPVIGILNTGTILEVTPTVSFDRKYVTMEVKPTLAIEGATRTSPNLSLGLTNIPFELPVITISKIRSSVTVPDGGTVLIGGLKNIFEQKMESGVPLAMDIPVVKNLFRRQAWSDLKRSLVVLVKANITLVRDEELARFGKKYAQ